MNKQTPPRKPSASVKVPSANQTPRPGTNTSPSTKAAGSSVRTSSRVVPTTPGGKLQHNASAFKLRPLDIALLLSGIVVVGIIIWGGMNASNTAAPAPAASTTGSTGSSTAAAENQPTTRVLNKGVPAPDFSLPATDGKTYKLSDYKGKVVMLEFMAPWCPHCQADAPMLNEVYTKYKDKDFMALGISATPYDRNTEKQRAAGGTPTPIAMDDMVWFKQTFNVAYPMLFDKNVTVGFNDYAVEYYPTLYIVDKASRVWEMMITERNNPLSVERISASVDAALAAR